jgi:hypothetical protein
MENFADVNARLANFAKGQELRASGYQSQADRARLEKETSNFPAFVADLEQQASDLEAQASRCRARAAEARNGYLLIDSDDIAFQMDYANRSLVSSCQAEGRCKYIEPQMSSNI